MLDNLSRTRSSTRRPETVVDDRLAGRAATACTSRWPTRAPASTDDERARLFERFYRGEASRGGAAGTGLGLSVVEALAARWEGRAQHRQSRGGRSASPSCSCPPIALYQHLIARSKGFTRPWLASPHDPEATRQAASRLRSPGLIAAAVAIGLLANTISGDSVGLSAEPLSAGDTLAPPASERRRAAARRPAQRRADVRRQRGGGGGAGPPRAARGPQAADEAADGPTAQASNGADRRSTAAATIRAGPGAAVGARTTAAPTTAARTTAAPTTAPARGRTTVSTTDGRDLLADCRA